MPTSESFTSRRGSSSRRRVRPTGHPSGVSPRPTTAGHRAATSALHEAIQGRGYTPAYSLSAAPGNMDEGLPYTNWGRGFYMHYGLPHDAIPGARERAGEILGALPEYLKADPRVKFAQPTPPGDSAYEQSWPKRGSRPVINLGDIATILLDDRSKRARDQGTQILIHEAIHANQPKRVLRKTNFREGMAELLSRKVAQEQYGIETPKSTYQPLVNELQRRYGSNSGRLLRQILTGGG